MSRLLARNVDMRDLLTKELFPAQNLYADNGKGKRIEVINISPSGEGRFMASCTVSGRPFIATFALIDKDLADISVRRVSVGDVRPFPAVPALTIVQ